MNTVLASYTDKYEHAFDLKGRITVPSEWRQPNFETTLYVLPPFKERCLKVYPASWLGEQQARVKGLPMDNKVLLGVQALAGQVQSLSFDTQGRVMIKQAMRDSAGLKRDVVLMGRLDHFEIWDEKTWNADNKATMSVAESLRAAGLWTP